MQCEARSRPHGTMAATSKNASVVNLDILRRFGEELGVRKVPETGMC